MCGRIKDWRWIAMQYDRCARTFFSAICIAATVIFYLKEWVLSPGSPFYSGSLIQSRNTWLRSALSPLCNHSLVSNCEQTAVGCSRMLIHSEAVVDTSDARRSACGESGQSREGLSVMARGHVTCVSGVSCVRHWAQKEDLWSANAVGGYWCARPSMI